MSGVTLPVPFRRNVPALFRGGERERICLICLKTIQAESMPLLAHLTMKEPSMKTPGPWGFVCFLFFRKTNNYARKGTTILASPGMSPWVHPGALPGHWYPPKVPAKGPRSAAEGAAQRSGILSRCLFGTSSPSGDIIPMSFRDIVPVRGYYPDVFSGHRPR